MTGLVLNYMYEGCGLKKDYSVLFDEAIRTPIFNIMIISTAISCLLAIVPILFYSLNEKQQEKIARELLERKAAE